MSSTWKSRTELLDDLTRLVEAGCNGAVFAPRYGGLTRLLGLLHDRLGQRIRARTSPLAHSSLVWLCIRAEEEPWSVARIVQELKWQLGQEARAGEHLDGDNALARSELATLLAHSAGRVALLLSPVDSASETVVRDLLEEMRLIENRVRPVVVLGGDRTLIDLTHGETALFADSQQFGLLPSSPSEAEADLTVLVGANNFDHWPPQLVDAVIGWTNGNWKLMEMLVALVHERTSNPNLGDWEKVQEKVLGAFSNEPLHSVAERRERWDQRAHEHFRPILDTLNRIQQRAEWLEIVARLCLDGGVAEYREAVHPDMCPAFRREGKQVVFACPLFSAVLKSYFTSLQVADAFVLCERWEQARGYYERAQPAGPQGLFKHDHYTMNDLIHAAFDSAPLGGDTHGVIQTALEAAVFLIGVGEAVLGIRGRTTATEGPAKAEAWDWRQFPTMDGTLTDQTARSADAALRGGEAVRFAGDRVLVVARTVGAGTRVMALGTRSRQRPQSAAQQRAAHLLLHLAAKAFEEAEWTRRREEALPTLVARTQLSRDVADLAAPPVELSHTAKVVLRAFEQAGFTDVMISLVDRDERSIKALDASGLMQPFKPHTHRIIKGDTISDEDDVLPYMVKRGLRSWFIPNCEDAVYRCNQDTIHRGSPPLRVQAVYTLKSDYPFAWPRSRVFGTVQIGYLNTQLSELEERRLEDLVRYATRVLETTLLIRDLGSSGQQRQQNLEMLRQVNLAYNDYGDIEDILQRILEAVVDKLKACAGSIRLIDPVLNELVFRAVVAADWPSDYVRKTYPLDESSTGGCIVFRGTSVLHPDVRKPGVPYDRREEKVESNCGVPIRVNGRVEGALVLDADRKAAFTVENIRSLEAVANVVGSLIGGSRMHAKERMRAEFEKILAAPADWSQHLRKIVELARDAVQADHASLFLRRTCEDPFIVLRATTSPHRRVDDENERYAIGQGRTGWVAKHAEPFRARADYKSEVLVRLYGADLEPQEFGILSEYVAAKDRSTLPPYDPNIDLLAVPLRGETCCWGVLRCVVRFQGHPKELFSHEKEELLVDLGRQLAITLDRRHAEELEHRKREQLIRQTTLDNIKEFAHDLKNPAASIKFLGSALQKQQDLAAVPEDVRRTVRQLTYKGSRIVELVDRFNRLVNPLLPHCRPEHLPALVQHVVDGTPMDNPYRLVVREPSSAWPLIPIDAAMLRTIVEELLANACAAMPRGGEVCVEFTGPHEPYTGPAAYWDRAYVTVAVSDTGPGVPPEKKQSIFLFGESIRAPKSTGLGLAIVRQYMELMGGTALEDGPCGKGARFRLVFSLVSSATAVEE